MIEKIVSGGQTGADRAALDLAIRQNFPYGGWCPKGRKAEDGVIGGQYSLVETPSSNYLQRTEWNVRDSDGTVVFTMHSPATGGSLRTIEFAAKLKKPCLHLWPCANYRIEESLIDFVNTHEIRVLNVAGSRASKEPDVYSWVSSVLEYAFFWSANNPWVLGGPGEG